MYNNSSFISLLVIFAFIMSSCSKESSLPELQEIDVIKTRLDILCDQGQIINFLNENEAIFDLYRRGEKIIYRTYDKVKVFDVITNRTDILLDSAYVHEIEESEEEIYLCTSRGLYRWKVEDNCCLEQITNFSCMDVAVSGSDNVFFISYSNGNSNIRRNEINIVDGNSYSLFGRVEAQVLQGLHTVSDNELWIVTDDFENRVIRMNDTGVVIGSFDSSNSPFQRNSYYSEIWMETFQNKTIIVSKNGFRLPIIAEWDGNLSAWSSLLDDQLVDQSESGDPKMRLLMAPTYTDVEIYGGRLYISTTLSGCVGLHRFNLESDYPLAYDDFDIIQDDRIQIGQCIQGIDITTADITIFSQRSAYLGSICN